MTINRSLIINVLVWTSLLAYLVFAVKHCSVKNAGIVCTGINVVVKDSTRYSFITPQTIEQLLKNKNIHVKGVKLDSLDILSIEKAISENPYIRRNKVYSTLDGRLNIEIKQRRPVVRIQSENGYSIYITDDFHAVPINSFPADVPIVTGVPQMPFTKDFTGDIKAGFESEKKSPENVGFIYNLINFVSFLDSSMFWGAQVVQINVIHGNQIELIPRVGDSVILLGGFDNYREKLDKLMKFYKKGLPYEGWNKYKYIDIRFQDQVICRT